MRGDRVEIVVDAGGDTRTYEIEATRAGRRVDITQGRGIIEVTETTRGGTAVRTARFMASRVLAIVEHPAPRPAQEDDEAPPRTQSADAATPRRPASSMASNGARTLASLSK